MEGEARGKGAPRCPRRRSWTRIQDRSLSGRPGTVQGIRPSETTISGVCVFTFFKPRTNPVRLCGSGLGVPPGRGCVIAPRTQDIGSGFAHLQGPGDKTCSPCLPLGRRSPRLPRGGELPAGQAWTWSAGPPPYLPEAVLPAAVTLPRRRPWALLPETGSLFPASCRQSAFSGQTSCCVRGAGSGLAAVLGHPAAAGLQ